MSASPSAYTPGVVDVIDTERRRPMPPRDRAAILGLLIAGLVLAMVLTHHQSRHQRSTSLTGSLTAAQYAAAQHVIGDWASHKGNQVSTAFAIIKPTNNPTFTPCPLVVTLVGRSAQVVAQPSPRPWLPGRVLIIARADPLSGRTCQLEGKYVMVPRRSLPARSICCPCFSGRRPHVPLSVAHVSERAVATECDPLGSDARLHGLHNRAQMALPVWTRAGFPSSPTTGSNEC